MSQGFSDMLSAALGATPRQRRAATTPASAPGPTTPRTVPAGGDGLKLSAASGPIQKLLAGQEPAIAEWPAVARQVATLGAGELLALNNRLAAAGAQIAQVDGGRYVLYRTADVSVIVDVARGRTRRAEGTRVTLHDGGRLAATMVALDGRITYTKGAVQQVWHGRSGQGTEGGRMLAIPSAPVVLGETPREPWGIPPRNQFRLPRHSEGMDPAVYVAAVDAAVERAGGQVVVPADAAVPDTDWTNCFSYALTRGDGDLADPFARNTMPRWLQSPMYQLAQRGWAHVGETQRVRPGDVVIYRDAEGQPSHAGVVREVDPQGNPAWVESKFGAWGVYLHRPFDVHPAYGVPADFYRKP